MLKDKFYLYFLPHPHTHQKAKLLHWHFILIYLLIFMLVKVGLDLVALASPGVLGINSDITVSQVIELTNSERQKIGLQSLKEDQALDQAAYEKAKNMFAENYWAHFSPSGKDPWGFISGSGYKFAYAGENLARNFYDSKEVIAAWMNSPTHKDNIINGHYQDIGIAVVDGVLQGQKTTLVVQMFGTKTHVLASAPNLRVQTENILTNSHVTKNNLPVLSKSVAIIDPFNTLKMFGLSIIGFLFILLAADLIVLKRRGVFALTSSRLAHLSFLGISGAGILISRAGEVL